MVQSVSSPSGHAASATRMPTPNTLGKLVLSDKPLEKSRATKFIDDCLATAQAHALTKLLCGKPAGKQGLLGERLDFLAYSDDDFGERARMGDATLRNIGTYAKAIGEHPRLTSAQKVALLN